MTIDQEECISGRNAFSVISQGLTYQEIVLTLMKTGVANLPLHYGRAPKWLSTRMGRLSREIVAIIVHEYGQNEFLRRISDPYWFQALGCVLGYDWHSSGVTTVVTGVLKKTINFLEHGIAICGGKGKSSRDTPLEINRVGNEFGFSQGAINHLKYASRISAKVDNAAIQDSHPLYHHAFFVTEDENWAVIQQGMNLKDGTARRYHWLSLTKNKREFVNEPHNAIVGEARKNLVLNMTAQESERCRKISVDLTREPTKKLINLVRSVRPAYQKSLNEWITQAKDNEEEKWSFNILSMPRRLNWETMRKVYEFQPRNYEELLGFNGVGPATVRGLALIAELIYGEKPSWRDPIKYSFAYGGKDGIPFPIDRKAMDESIQILQQAVIEAKIERSEKIRSLHRLRQLIPENSQANMSRM